MPAGGSCSQPFCRTPQPADSRPGGLPTRQALRTPLQSWVPETPLSRSTTRTPRTAPVLATESRGENSFEQSQETSGPIPGRSQGPSCIHRRPDKSGPEADKLRVLGYPPALPDAAVEQLPRAFRERYTVWPETPGLSRYQRPHFRLDGAHQALPPSFLRG